MTDKEKIKLQKMAVSLGRTVSLIFRLCNKDSTEQRQVSDELDCV